MTLRPNRSLLEDFVDHELPDEEAEQFKKLLATSPDLQRELDETVRLKKLLSQQPVPDPGEEYWGEAEKLILAQTIESEDEEPEIISVTEELSRKKRAFYRSLVSAAASLVILGSALVIGSNRGDLKLATAPESQVPLVTASLDQTLESGVNRYVADAEKEDMAVAMMLLGAPGHVGRIVGAHGLFDLE